MCGISGIIKQNISNLDSVKLMNDLIKHRGPDDEGFVFFNDEGFEVLGGDDTNDKCFDTIGDYLPKEKLVNSEFKGTVALAHRRLSILDLSPTGHQPMCSSNLRYWITFNGEIYNYIEIRDELISLGHIFFSKTDTEVILNAYAQWGIECQNKFNGMWSFVIYDRVNKSIFLSRDRFGIKPLYYWFSPNNEFYFGSEIKQFTNLPNWKAILNKKRAFDFLYYSLTDHTDETLFSGVYNIPPGCYYLGSVSDLFKTNSHLNYLRWFNLEKNISSVTFDEAKQTFLNCFKDSIKLHLRSDVPIGYALSGGLDSSSIVAYANLYLSSLNNQITQKTFSSCSHDKRFDERKWMEQVIEDINIDPNYIYPIGEDVFNITEKIIWNMDEPYQSQSAFLGYHVYQKAKAENIKVLINGQGADEYLSGYSSNKILRQKKLFKKLKFKELKLELRSNRELLKLFTLILQDFLPTKYRNKLSFYSKKHKMFDKVFNLSKLMTKKEHPYYKVYDTKNDHFTISKYQILKNPLQKYLRWEDRNSMAHSVEARVPFLDFRLVEFTLSLPLEYLDAPNISKRVFVEAMEGILPENVRNRKDKKGFITPEEHWFTSEYKNKFIKLFDENVKYSKGIINVNHARNYLIKMQNGLLPFDYSYWRIISFSIWMKVFNVQL